MGKPALNALIAMLLSYDETSVTEICLVGIQIGIHLGGVLNLKVGLDALNMLPGS